MGGLQNKKKSFLPKIYLENTAATFLDNLENNNPTATWEQVEQALRLEFEPTAQSHMLRTMLEKRKQLPDETTASYINDAENLCKRIDPNMSQSELTHTIMKGLKPEISRYVGILDNYNLDELKKNIRKYESIEFMINGNTIQSHDDIRAQITKEHINIIEDTKNKKQIDLLTAQMSKL
uniref:Retrotransposon gag domain-containing protein n=1 Tax=Schizaphis graminum TaxID=13262 RepID=A0A2S2NY16_SCHGA